MSATRQENLLEVKNLCKYFYQRRAVVKAVDNVSFHIARGETLGLVGESGCGKTTCGRTILKLYPPTAGEIIYKGREITGRLSFRELQAFKKSAQIIFQDPYSSLDPRMTIGEIIAEGMEVHFHYTKKERQARVADLSRWAHGDYANRFHELSGGQRQRWASPGPWRWSRVHRCDEPISALDVSIQAQIVNLLINPRGSRTSCTVHLHDLSMVRHISDRIGVMYLGRVELSPSQDLFAEALHPTRGPARPSPPDPNTKSAPAH